MRSYQLTSRFNSPFELLKSLFLLWLACAWSPLAWSHTLPSGHGTINVNGDKAYVVLSLPVHSFEGVDDNGDGKLSALELSAHRDVIDQQIQRGFVFYNANKTPHTMKTMAITLVADQEQHTHDHSHGQHNHNHHSNMPADTVNYLGIVSFSENVTHLRVESYFFTLSKSKHTPTDYVFKLFAKHSAQNTHNEQPIKREMVTLSPTQTRVTFLTDFSSFSHNASQLGSTHETMPLAAQRLQQDNPQINEHENKPSVSKPLNIFIVMFFGMALFATVLILWFIKTKKDIDEQISKQAK